ncbi:histidine kinase [Methylocella sp.]
MPTLLRFLAVIAILAGLAFAAMVALVAFVKPEQREIVETIAPQRLNK